MQENSVRRTQKMSKTNARKDEQNMKRNAKSNYDLIFIS
jgi:hypothetical protein